MDQVFSRIDAETLNRFCDVLEAGVAALRQLSEAKTNSAAAKSRSPSRPAQTNRRAKSSDGEQPLPILNHASFTRHEPTVQSRSSHSSAESRLSYQSLLRRPTAVDTFTSGFPSARVVPDYASPSASKKPNPDTRATVSTFQDMMHLNESGARLHEDVTRIDKPLPTEPSTARAGQPSPSPSLPFPIPFGAMPPASLFVSDHPIPSYPEFVEGRSTRPMDPPPAMGTLFSRSLSSGSARSPHPTVGTGATFNAGAQFLQRTVMTEQRIADASSRVDRALERVTAIHQSLIPCTTFLAVDETLDRCVTFEGILKAILEQLGTDHECSDSCKRWHARHDKLLEKLAKFSDTFLRKLDRQHGLKELFGRLDSFAAHFKRFSDKLNESFRELTDAGLKGDELRKAYGLPDSPSPSDALASASKLRGSDRVKIGKSKAPTTPKIRRGQHNVGSTHTKQQAPGRDDVYYTRV